jgi:hypothetical protein
MNCHCNYYPLLVFYYGTIIIFIIIFMKRDYKFTNKKATMVPSLFQQFSCNKIRLLKRSYIYFFLGSIKRHKRGVSSVYRQKLLAD